MTFESLFVDLIVRSFFVGNPLKVQTVYVRRWHVQVKKEPAREVKNWGKALFGFPSISYLFLQEQLAPTVGHELIPYQAIRTRREWSPPAAELESWSTRRQTLLCLQATPRTWPLSLRGKPKCNKNLLT